MHGQLALNGTMVDQRGSICSMGNTEKGQGTAMALCSNDNTHKTSMLRSLD